MMIDLHQNERVSVKIPFSPMGNSEIAYFIYCNYVIKTFISIGNFWVNDW